MSKKFRFFIAYLVHYFKRYFLLVLLGIVFGSVVFVQRNHLFRFYQTIIPTQSNIGLEGIYTTKSLPSSIANQISYGFTIITDNNRPILSPIISNLDVKDNNLSYTFTFKNDLYWHNGQKFQTSDLNINIPQATISIVSTNTIKITLQDPYSPLLTALSKPLFLKNSLIGLGPYRAKNISYQDGYIKLLQLSSTNNQQNLAYHFYPNSTDLFNAFKLGEVDEISTTTFNNQLNNWQKIKINPSISTSEYLAIFLNTEKFSNKQDRQAIAYATPKSSDKNKRCFGPISPNSWAYNFQVKPYNFNPTRAKELLEENSLEPINLTITDRRLLNQAEIIKKSWEEILKVKVNLNITSGQIDSTSYDALLTYNIIPIDPDQYFLWHSTQNETNITHLNNSRIDKLLEEGRQVIDQLERKKIYYDFQRFLLEESPVIFLEYPTTYTISRLK